MTVILIVYFTGAIVSFWTAMLTATDDHTSFSEALSESIFFSVGWPVWLPVVTLAILWEAKAGAK